MFTKLMAVLIAVTLVFGGAVATASAAQTSLPLDALYPLKTLGESVELGLSVSSADKLDKALVHLQRRVDEMASLAAMGVTLPKHVEDDYSERVEYALRLAAKMSDAEMTRALEKIQQTFQEQLAAVEKLQAARPDDVQLANVTALVRQHLDLVQKGLSDPQMFREQLAAMLQGSEGPSSTQDPSVTEEPSVTETPEPSDDNSNNANSNDDDSNTNSDDSANINDDDSNTNNDDSANINDDDDSNGNGDDDSNGNDDDSNSNDDDSNSNDDDGNSNDDDGNSNDDDGNSNGDDDSNGNGDDDSNGNDDDSNSNDDDDSNSNSDDDSNGNDDSKTNGSGGSGNGVTLNSILVLVARLGGFTLSY